MPGVEAFQTLWGDKAELRRFKDGTILDCVLWGQGSTGVPKGDMITEEIIRHIMKTHLPFHSDHGKRVVTVSNRLQGILPSGPPDYIKSAGEDATISWDYPSANYDATTLFRKAVEALDHLRGLVTSNIKDMPLVIDSLSASSSNLRYTAFLPPVAHPLVDGSKTALNAYAGSVVSRIVAPLHVIASLQRSSKWPNELTAVRNIKSALALRLSQCLLQQFQV